MFGRALFSSGADVITIISWLLSVLAALFYGVLVRNAKGPGYEPTRTRYFETIRTLVTAASVAMAIVSAIAPRNPTPHSFLKWAAGCLTVSVMLSVATMLEMSRIYEKAGPQALNQEKASTTASSPSPTPVGPKDLLSILILGLSAIVAFLMGFIYLARLVISL